MTRISIITQGKAPTEHTEFPVEYRHHLQPGTDNKPPTWQYGLVFVTLVVVLATSIGAVATLVRLLSFGPCVATGVVTSAPPAAVIAPTAGPSSKLTELPTRGKTDTPPYTNHRVGKVFYNAWPHADDGKVPFSLDDMYNPELVPRSPQGQWAGDEDVTYFNDRRELVLHNINSNTKKIIMTNETFIKYNPDYYTLSPDRKFILITYDLITELQDASTFGKHKIYNRETGELLSFPNDAAMKDRIVMYTAWTPTGTGLSFVFDDDMYYQKDPLSSPERLTTSGATHKIRNGLSFWNYQGVLQDNAAIWWSPDLSLLAYGEFNSTEITLSEQPIYNQQVYPSMFRQVYLQAGDAAHFSHSKLHIINMKDPQRTRKTLSPPTEFADKDHYFYRLLWKDNTDFAIGWTDRIQKRSVIEFCDAATLDCMRNHDTIVQNGWFTGPHLLQFINDGADYLAVLPKVVGTHGRYRQVAMVSSETGAVTFLTHGTKEVYWVDAYDSTNHLVYFTGTNGFQLEQHLFSVGTPEADADSRPMHCLSCSEDCGYVEAIFNPSTANYLLSCKGPGVPYFHLRWTRDAKRSYTVEDNAAVKTALDTRQLPSWEYHELDVGDGYTGWAEFILPPGMVKDGSVKYPVMFYPYAGPHGTTQADFRYKGYSAAGGLWDYHLASAHHVIVVRLNGRGSGGRGDEYLFQLYRRLGTVEVSDQIDGARSLIKKFPYIDSSRMAVWGWSYGGFTTSHIIGDHSKVFTCGISVAPVTNFRHYYAGYTERYMDLDTKEDNAAGYDRTDVIKKADNFHGKKYMLVHGSLDDNVHFQNAMELMNALSKAQVLFRTQVYVDQNHSIRKRELNRHLFLSMTDFYTKECLRRDD